ncbi:hypothetical protein [Streptomyces afghaniensis]|uniref:hypothetical protein n=1 Tax=Streptomyces afghaniensis TaxID=66865 RepID=UPI002780DD65|nr:hypothetical protein [Streptomyces afghaniensis]MDQ1019889.1 hypothetical protein [Streptomyces afghaniensis]
MVRPTKAQRAAIAQRRADAIDLKLAGLGWLTIGRKLAADPAINSDRVAHPPGTALNGMPRASGRDAVERAPL